MSDASTGDARVRIPVADLFGSIDADATVTNQLLYGERVRVLDEVDAVRVRVAATLDGYAGIVARAALEPAGSAAATHVVAVRATLRFPGPGIKRVPVLRLPAGSRVVPLTSSSPNAEGLVECADGGWIHHAHLRALDAAPACDSPLAAARERWLGAPYLWGGRTPDGCDCSGLLQGCARDCGVELPRDSGDQERTIDETVALEDRRTDDLVFWPGHVAIVAESPARVLHANAHTLSVALEPLDEVIRRAGPPGSVRRLPR